MTRRLKVSLLSSLAILGLGIGFAGALPAAAATTIPAVAATVVAVHLPLPRKTRQRLQTLPWIQTQLFHWIVPQTLALGATQHLTARSTELLSTTVDNPLRFLTLG